MRVRLTCFTYECLQAHHRTAVSSDASADVLARRKADQLTSVVETEKENFGVLIVEAEEGQCVVEPIKPSHFRSLLAYDGLSHERPDRQASTSFLSFRSSFNSPQPISFRFLFRWWATQRRHRLEIGPQMGNTRPDGSFNDNRLVSATRRRCVLRLSKKSQ